MRDHTKERACQVFWITPIGDFHIGNYSCEEAAYEDIYEKLQELNEADEGGKHHSESDFEVRIDGLY